MVVSGGGVAESVIPGGQSEGYQLDLSVSYLSMTI